MISIPNDKTSSLRLLSPEEVYILEDFVSNPVLTTSLDFPSLSVLSTMISRTNSEGNRQQQKPDRGTNPTTFYSKQINLAYTF